MKSFYTYLINLDTATRRLQRMDEQLRMHQIPYERVSAVIGDELSEPIKNFDAAGYRLRIGKMINKREIGCYFSHIKAMRRFLCSEHSHALILEDDATLREGLCPLLEKVIAGSDQWDLLRLSSSRQGHYLELRQLNELHRLAINTKVLKNTAAYLINRHAAHQCVNGLLPMRRPFDVALDRDWKLDMRTACVIPFPIGHGEIPSQIPPTPRIQPWRATTFHLFHLMDRVTRWRYRKRIFSDCHDRQDSA